LVELLLMLKVWLVKSRPNSKTLKTNVLSLNINKIKKKNANKISLGHFLRSFKKKICLKNYLIKMSHILLLILFQQILNHLNFLWIEKEKENKKFCEDENIQFNFIGTKIKIRYIYRDEKLI